MASPSPSLRTSSSYFLLLPLWLLLWTSRVVVCQPAPMDKAEKFALFSTIRGFIGDSWNGSDLYPDPCGWTPIQGVSCDLYNGLWYITAMSFGPVHGNSLICSAEADFSPKLFELTHLKALFLYDCFAERNLNSVSLPSSGWERLASSLESMEFRSNRGLVGQLPSGLSRLANLDSLVFMDNGLEGQLPSSFANLTRLKRLVLSSNSFTGAVPASYGRLTDLLILDLSRNSLAGSLPPSLGGLTQLLKLDLSNNRQLSGNLPQELNNLRNLTLLDLRNNNFIGGLTFEGMSLLEGMLLSHNPLGGSLGSIAWGNLKRLEIVDLDNLGLTGPIPKSISKLKRLRYLSLGNNNLTGNIPWEEISSLPCLNVVLLNGNNLAGELKFPEWFYRKLGRRFSASNNPELCYPSELISKGTQPHGVRSCRRRDIIGGYGYFEGDMLGNGDGVGRSHNNNTPDSSSSSSSSYSLTIGVSWVDIGYLSVAEAVVRLFFFVWYFGVR